MQHCQERMQPKYRLWITHKYCLDCIKVKLYWFHICNSNICTKYILQISHILIQHFLSEVPIYSARLTFTLHFWLIISIGNVSGQFHHNVVCAYPRKSQNKRPRIQWNGPSRYRVTYDNNKMLATYQTR